MSKIFWKSLLVSPAILGATLAFSASAIASEAEAGNVSVDSSVSVSSLEQINLYSNEGANNLAQVTSVSQLSDVQPTDWYFQALQSLVERYGCIAGYPDGTYRGDRALTRGEFAAGLNACLDRVLEIVTVGGEIDPEDLATIRRLQEEFAAELATLRGRVDSLEARTAELEANQFSTTTKLNGETIFSVSGAGQDDSIEPYPGAGFTYEADEDQIAAGYRVRLNLDTSFTGSDRLRARLQSRDVPNYTTDPEGFSFGGGDDNDIRLDDLYYTFPLGQRAEILLGLNSIATDDLVASTISPFDNSGSGGLNDFSLPPQYKLFSSTGVGAGAIVQLTDNLSVDFGYTTSEGTETNNGAGLFNGDYSAIGQLTYLSNFIDAAFTYVHSYIGDGGVFPGSGSLPGGALVAPAGAAFLGAPGSVGNTYGGQVNFKFGGFEIGGGLSYTDIIQLQTGDAELWSWQATLAFPDLGGEGNLLGIYGGQVPSWGRAVAPITGVDYDQTYLIEGFYRYQLNDNIALTPGVIWIINPAFNSNNEDTVIGALRTTFRF